MRYPRNAKIFRGQIDAAPFAGLFFLLVLMLLLYGKNVFIPGVRIQLKEAAPAEPEDRTLAINSSGRIDYLGNRYDFKKFEARMRAQAQAGSIPGRVRFVVAPATDPELVAQVERVARELGVSLRPPGRRLEVPASAGFPGTENPSVVVGINLNGQVFFQHQVVKEQELQQKLSSLTEKEARLTMVLQADKSVPLERITRLMAIARLAGVYEVLLADRPG
jgi:biopolymer transport protein ExbD